MTNRHTMITELLKSGNPEQIITELKTRPANYPLPQTEDIKKQFNVTTHKVFDQTYRPKKLVKSINQETGSEEISYIDVARIAFPFQKTIVKRAASFLFGSDVQLSYDTGGNQSLEKVAQMLKKILSATKSSNLNKQIARTLFSETEVAEYWYPVRDENFWGKDSTAKFKLRCKIFSPFLGDTLYPHFDEYGDMDAFSRGYIMKEDNGTGGTVDIEYLDCFTREETIRFKKTTEGWVRIVFVNTDPQTGEQTEVVSSPNMARRIPIVFYYQDYPDWQEVQNIIERFEDSLSNFADTNDYFARPILTIDGEIRSMPEKAERGKIIETDTGVKASYLTWDQAPEAIKLELDTLEQAIYANSQTPNISFEKVKGLGSLSGVAIKLLFMDAHLKAQDKIEIFGTALQRRYNIIKGFIGSMDIALKGAADELEVSPVITPYMPSNEKELVDYLTTAAGGKAIMSRKTAIQLLGQTDDVEGELKQIESEEQVTTSFETQNATE